MELWVGATQVLLLRGWLPQVGFHHSLSFLCYLGPHPSSQQHTGRPPGSYTCPFHNVFFCLCLHCCNLLAQRSLKPSRRCPCGLQSPFPDVLSNTSGCEVLLGCIILSRSHKALGRWPHPQLAPSPIGPSPQQRPWLLLRLVVRGRHLTQDSREFP